MHYDLKDLRLFLDIVRTKSFRLAAERNFMTISAVSVRIRNLEAGFNTRLLNRKPRLVEVTEAGERFAEEAKLLLVQARNLDAKMERFSGRHDDTVRFFTNYVALSGRLKSDIGYFLRDNPDVRIDFTFLRRKPIIEALLDGEADIGVLGYTEDIKGLSFTPYVTCAYVLLVSAKSRAARRISSSVTLAELEDFPLMALSKETTIQEFFEEMAKNQGVKLDIRARFPSLYSALEPMRIIDGGILAPKDCEVAQLDTVRAIDINEPWNRQDLRLCVPSDAQRVSPNTLRLLTFLQETTKKVR